MATSVAAEKVALVVEKEEMVTEKEEVMVEGVLSTLVENSL